MCLTKVNFCKNFNHHHILHLELLKWIKNNPLNYGIIALDYMDRVRKTWSIVPFKFINTVVFKFVHTFQQNNKSISRKIRKEVCKMIKNTNVITCIGGESYFYPILNDIKCFKYYTNSVDLYKEAKFNSNLTKIVCNAYIVNYNTIEDIGNPETILINLSKLNTNLIKLINNSNTTNIIIISCHHKDFWKKIKYLTNYKIMKRIRFLAHNYYVSVNLLKFKI